MDLVKDIVFPLSERTLRTEQLSGMDYFSKKIGNNKKLTLSFKTLDTP